MLIPAIGFCGEAQSGKDTAASFLVDELGYTRVAFADPLKEEFAQQLLNPTAEWEECLRLNHLTVAWSMLRMDFLLDVAALDEPQTFIAAYKDLYRPYLQLYGTEFRRAQDPDYWVKITASRLNPTERYVFTDVRFPNEHTLIASLGGVLCCLYRDDAGATNGINGHPSEQPDRLISDITFYNNGSLDALRDFVLALAESESLNSVTDLAACARG